MVRNGDANKTTVGKVLIFRGVIVGGWFEGYVGSREYISYLFALR